MTTKAEFEKILTARDLDDVADLVRLLENTETQAYAQGYEKAKYNIGQGSVEKSLETIAMNIERIAVQYVAG